MTADRASELERIRIAYFSDPQRRLSLSQGQMLLDQDQPNQRLFLIHSGHLVGYRRYLHEGEAEQFVEVFRAGPGAFIGLQSFFSRSYSSSGRIIADSDVDLAWMDRDTHAVEPEIYGSLTEQFMPLMVHELAARSMRAAERAFEKEAATRQLHRSEMMTTLGQLAAGLAHELNNAIGVIARKTDYVGDFLNELLLRHVPAEAAFFRRGLETGALVVDEVMRKRVRDYERNFAISRQAARMLARIAPSVEDARSLGEHVIAQLERFARYWELGRDVHDMKIAARHAAGIVKSVKVLGGGNFERSDGIDLRESLEEALALVKSNLRAVQVDLLLPAEPLAKLHGNMTELVQIWVNLIKNACDAMEGANTASPALQIKVQGLKNQVVVAITDNGPGVPEALRDKIFQPDFTTKKSGLSFGLGLGLAIVQRLVESYGGDIALKSRPGKTTFKVKLPIENSYGKN